MIFHTSSANGARGLAQLPARTRLQVLSGVHNWHRVKLEDGRAGFIPGQVNLLGMQ